MEREIYMRRVFYATYRIDSRARSQSVTPLVPTRPFTDSDAPVLFHVGFMLDLWVNRALIYLLSYAILLFRWLGSIAYHLVRISLREVSGVRLRSADFLRTQAG